MLVNCHSTAQYKADNSGCECPAGAFAHGDLSTAACHAGHAPIPHNLDGWLSAIRANNPTLVAHFISGMGKTRTEQCIAFGGGGGYHQAAETLIEDGADIDRKNGAGDAPLHPAVRNERAELITLLLQRGGGRGRERR